MSQKIEDKADAAEARTQQTRGFMQQVRVVPQATGCMASAWARLADIGDVNATRVLEKDCGHKIPQEIIEVGLLQKARFTHMS